jgi:tryptophanyl-tRNA synthetase
MTLLLEKKEDKAVMTAFEVKGDTDYDEFMQSFGAKAINDELIDKLEKATGMVAHPLIKNGVFFAHRELNKFIDAYINGEKVYIYSGRGPSAQSLHLGHMISFNLLVYLQKAFKCPVVIQIADDEKFYMKQKDDKRSFDIFYKLGFENAKDIIACGFDPHSTFIFSNRQYRTHTPTFISLVAEMQEHVTSGLLSDIFGFNSSANVGMINCPIYQSAAAFSQAFAHIFGDTPAHCLVAYGADQDVYFRLCRDLATKLCFLKPKCIISKFIPPLTGPGKMSSSTSSESTIFMTDAPDVVRKKIMKYACSGGGGNGSMDDHKRLGGNINKDIPCVYMKYLETDKDKLDNMLDGFKKGTITCKETKEMLAEKLIEIVSQHQLKRMLITDEVLAIYYAKKPMDLAAVKLKEKTSAEEKLYSCFAHNEIKHTTFYHEPITDAASTIELVPRIGRNVQLCNNITLTDGHKQYLLICKISTEINLKLLAKEIKVKNMKYVKKDTPTPFDIINETNKVDIIIMEESLMEVPMVGFYPLRNDATVIISMSDVIKFTNSYGYVIQKINKCCIVN